MRIDKKNPAAFLCCFVFMMCCGCKRDIYIKSLTSSAIQVEGNLYLVQGVEFENGGSSLFIVKSSSQYSGGVVSSVSSSGKTTLDITDYFRRRINLSDVCPMRIYFVETVPDQFCVYKSTGSSLFVDGIKKDFNIDDISSLIKAAKYFEPCVPVRQLERLNK